MNYMNANKRSETKNKDTTSFRVPKTLLEKLEDLASRQPVPPSKNKLGLVFLEAMIRLVEIGDSSEVERIARSFSSAMDPAKEAERVAHQAPKPGSKTSSAGR
jgi:hypothetical protein